MYYPNLSHHKVPGQGDSIPPLFGGVILPEGVLEELLHVSFGLLLVHCGQNDSCDLEKKE
jgi:hypothetical protein